MTWTASPMKLHISISPASSSVTMFASSGFVWLSIGVSSRLPSPCSQCAARSSGSSSPRRRALPLSRKPAGCPAECRSPPRRTAPTRAPRLAPSFRPTAPPPSGTNRAPAASSPPSSAAAERTRGSPRTALPPCSCADSRPRAPNAACKADRSSLAPTRPAHRHGPLFAAPLFSRADLERRRQLPHLDRPRKKAAQRPRSTRRQFRRVDQLLCAVRQDEAFDLPEEPREKSRRSRASRADPQRDARVHADLQRLRNAQLVTLAEQRFGLGRARRRRPFLEHFLNQRFPQRSQVAVRLVRFPLQLEIPFRRRVQRHFAKRHWQLLSPRFPHPPSAPRFPHNLRHAIDPASMAHACDVRVVRIPGAHFNEKRPSVSRPRKAHQPPVIRVARALLRAARPVASVRFGNL